MKPERIVWIFCVGRSGSTWLASMMRDIEENALWDEPLVGALFGEFYYLRAAHRRGEGGILGEPYRDTWMGTIRSLVLAGASARYPELMDTSYLIIKEPHGSIGAPLLSEALPESKFVFLIRDPRDATASALDGQREGGWSSETRRRKGIGKGGTADKDPDAFVMQRAKLYLRDMKKAWEAYEAHEGPKALVRYEDLRDDTLDTMQRIHRELSIDVNEEEISRVVEKHAWENVPEEKKGAGKFYRKASPGGWREDLTPEQVSVIEEITAPLLQKFYPDR